MEVAEFHHDGRDGSFNGLEHHRGQIAAQLAAFGNDTDKQNFLRANAAQLCKQESFNQCGIMWTDPGLDANLHQLILVIQLHVSRLSGGAHRID